MIDPSQILRKKGLDPSVLYVATVVDTEDPMEIGRVRARVVHLYDGIPDDKLPWAISLYNHVDGAFINEEDEDERSGVFDVPGEGSAIFLQFPDGNPLFPINRGYAADQKTMLPEAKEDYPNRLVVRMRNGTWLIVDKKTNEIFINSSGDLNMTILGDVNQTIVGTHTLNVTDSVDDIPGHIKDLPGTILSKMAAAARRVIPFTGLLGQGSGSSHTTVAGDQTMTIKGSRKVIVEGDDVLEVKGNRSMQIDGGRTLNIGQGDNVTAGGDHIVRARTIHHN